MEVLTGVILSNGSLVKKYKNGGTYLKFAQSVIHTGYFMWVFNIFANQDLCNITTLQLVLLKLRENHINILHLTLNHLKNGIVFMHYGIKMEKK